MKKLFLFMSWVMLILSGCADEDIIERNSPSFPQSVNTRSAGDGVYDILGYGYDITGPYLDTKSSRAIVFDTNKLLEKGLITPYKLEESRFRYSSGKDVIDFTTNMSSSLQMSTPGILKVIGGASLNIAFGGNSHYNSDYSFAYCTQQYIDSRYRISVIEILPDIDKYGNSYAKPIYTPRFPDSLSPCDTGQGAACCLYDLDNNGFLDAIFVAIENIKGKSNSWKYVTGHNLNKQGVPMC